MDRWTLRDRVIRDTRGGPSGLLDHRGKGRPRRLTQGQQAALQAIVGKAADPELDGLDVYVQPIPPLVELCPLVWERFGVT